MALISGSVPGSLARGFILEFFLGYLPLVRKWIADSATKNSPTAPRALSSNAEPHRA